MYTYLFVICYIYNLKFYIINYFDMITEMTYINIIDSDVG